MGRSTGRSIIVGEMQQLGMIVFSDKRISQRRGNVKTKTSKPRHSPSLSLQTPVVVNGGFSQKKMHRYGICLHIVRHLTPDIGGYVMEDEN